VLQEESYKKELLNNTESSEQEDCSGCHFKAQLIKDDWAQVTTTNYRKNYDFNSNLIQIIPTTANRYELLSNLKDEETINLTTKVVKIQNSNNYLQTKKKNQLVKSVGISEHKVLIIGDSYAKKCVTELRHNLDHRYEVCGFIKPGARTSEIIKTAEKEVSTDV
jgi:hypothetical protein